MKWFRLATTGFLLVTLAISCFLVVNLIQMFVDPDEQKHLESDPRYNGTLSVYVVMLMFQFVFIIMSIDGIRFGLLNWKSNFALTKLERIKYIWWLSAFGLTTLIILGLSIYIIVKGKNPREEMSYMYEAFAKANQDTEFINAFEKYQKEKHCCGIYGPDDWLMIQLRTGMGGGGGGGGFQSMDYGFQQNPSTGHCHMLPPKIPMGCGRKMLEQIHATLAMYAGLLIMETVVVIITEVLGAYCFFYWLEQVAFHQGRQSSISIDPEHTGSGGGSSHSGGKPNLGPPAHPDYPSLGRHSGSPSVTHKGSNDHGGMTTSIGHNGTLHSLIGMGSSPTKLYDGSHLGSKHYTDSLHYGSYMHKGSMFHQSSLHYGAYMHSLAPEPTVIIGSANLAIGSGVKKTKKHNDNHSTNHLLHKQENALGGKVIGEMHMNKDKSEAKKDKNGKTIKHATIAIVRNKKAKKPKTLFGKNSEEDVKENSGHTGNLANDIAAMSGNNEVLKNKMDDVVLPVEDKHNPTPMGKGGYLKKLQETKKAKDEKEKRDNAVSGNQAQNNLDGMLNPGAVETHLTKAKEEDLLIKPHLAVEPHPPKHGHGGYLGTGSHENAHYLPGGVKYLSDGTKHLHDHYLPDGTRYLPDGTRYLPDGGQGHYLPDGPRYLQDGGYHQHDHYLPDGTRYLPDGTRYLPDGGQGHYLPDGTRYLQDGGHHQKSHYLPDGGHHKDLHYLPDGGHHQNVHYLPDGSHHKDDHYLPDGGHHNHKDDHYLPDGGHHKDPHYLPDGGHHKGAHYLPDGGHHKDAHYLTDGGHHKDAHYLPDGGHHKDAHYLTDGGHHKDAHYLPDGGHHKGAHYLADGGHHKDAHYLPDVGHHKDAHYLPDGGHHKDPHHLPDRGNHQDAHYLPEGGHHKDDHYLPDGGHQKDAHYLPDGGHHQNAHYLPDGGHHKDAHYLPDGGHHKDPHHLPDGGHHQDAHYLPDGGHHQDAHYLPDGGHHEDVQDLHDKDHHQDPHRLPDGGHHQDPHHLPDGGHHQDPHHLPDGGHHQDPHHSLNGGHHQDPHHSLNGGHHQDPHHSLNGGHHQDPHHSLNGGHHQDAQYLPPGGPQRGEKHHQMHDDHNGYSSVRSKRVFNMKTEIIYKNPKPMSDD